MSDRDPHNAADPFRVNRTWARMFADALRGVGVAVAREINFAVHGTIAAAVVGVGVYVGLSLERWCLLVLCATLVLTAEMLNTAIEHLARAVTREAHPEVRDALDVASGAVLLAAIGAAGVGVIAIVWPLVEHFG